MGRGARKVAASGTAPSAPGTLTPYEQEREEKLRANKARLAEIGIEAPPPPKQESRKRPRDDEEKPTQELRRSTRPRTTVQSYTSPPSPPFTKDMRAYSSSGASASAAASGGGASYAPPSAPPARRAVPCSPDAGVKRNSRGEIVFSDHPEFSPRLTPRQMISAGVFGGCYFNPKGGKPGIFGRVIAVDHREYPESWFAGLAPSMYNSRRYNIKTNKYGVKAGQDQAFWEQNGWINKQDPRGWFQWYTRFFLGRRTEDDARQISRWVGVAGPKGRWKRALLNKIVDAHARFDDGNISPVIRQTLLHWAFETTEEDVRKHKR
mmetsp:Transcript_4372/g.15169  ORF Transcript_4372/g.15169 Transcript_4372/m.15169 type:complete len:321 (-) Transcript_4372:80-1042(-)